MKRSLIYNETSYTVYICGIAKGSIGTDLDLSYIVHCLYKNLNLEMYKDTYLLFTIHRRTKNG